MSYLKTYNESLPVNAKILDGSGRLLDPAELNGEQQHRLSDLFGKGTGLDYSVRVSNRMQPTFA